MFWSWLALFVCLSPGSSWGAQPPESLPEYEIIEHTPTDNSLSEDGSCEVGSEVGQCMMMWQCMHQGGHHAGLCQYKRLFGTCCILSKTKVNTQDSIQKILSPLVNEASSKYDDLAHIAELIAEIASSIISPKSEKNIKSEIIKVTEAPYELKEPDDRRIKNPRKKPNKSNNNRLIAIDPLRTGEGCGVIKVSIPEGRIVNGTNSSFGEFPWQVSIRADKGNGFHYSHHCGGTLISKSWVLTAAHCLKHIRSIEMLKVRIGEHDLAEENELYPYVDRKVKRNITHPKFDFPTFKYDIALLELSEPVPEQPNIGYICLPGSNNDLKGLKSWATGWGRLSDEGPLPSVLQKVPLTIMKNKECKKRFETAGRKEEIPKIFLCAADEGRDACSGDSGGPLQVRDSSGQWFLGGIVSWGIGCARPNHPGVYTRVSKFMPFIKKTIFKNS